MRIPLASVLIGLGVVVPCAAQAPPMPAQGQIVKRTYVSATDGATVDYALWVPNAYSKDRAWPLIVFLHGSGEGKSWEAPTNADASIPVRSQRNDLQYLVAFPLMRGSVTITGLAERDVLETLADVQASYRVDPDRVHLTGISFGGFAAWQIACHYPHLFASVTPFCGGGDPELAVNLRHVPVRVYHGARDTNVLPAHSRDMVEALQKAKLKPEYHELSGVGHVCWRGSYGDRKFYQWLEPLRRVAAPSRISYRTTGLRHSQAYWATIEGMVDPSQPAFIDVLAPGEGAVVVYATNVSRLLLNPPGGGERGFVDHLGKRIRAERAQGGWLLGLVPTSRPALLKKPGLSGPIQDVFNDSFAIVLSSGASEWTRAANTAIAPLLSMVYRKPRILKDVQVTPEIAATTHLICFGEPGTHQLLAQVEKDLPLSWRGGSVIVGDRRLPNVAAMVMICPNPRAPARYLVVCAGGPSAIEALAARVLQPPMLSPVPREDLVLLTDDGRFLFLDPSATQPVESPRMNSPVPPRGLLFDSAWQLPGPFFDTLKSEK